MDDTDDVSAEVGEANAQLAARIRAALAYARITDADAAAIFGVKVRQFSRYKSGDWKRTPPSSDALDELARRTRVPRMFLDQGWDALLEPPSADERIVALEARLDALFGALSSAKRGDPLDVIAQAIQEGEAGVREHRQAPAAAAADVAGQGRPGQGQEVGDA